jgi:hypothetical protein
MKNIMMKVLVPELKQDAQGFTKDPHQGYMGVSLPNGVRPSTVGEAVIVGGTKVGTKWMNCVYHTHHFSVPGIGEITELP